ncbi:hypothetical protein J6590_061360 [Homalodisca vitripennis]|nr:hypothetical protein J6590_061360 [Homalodisca vitripennis]
MVGEKPYTSLCKGLIKQKMGESLHSTRITILSALVTDRRLTKRTYHTQTSILPRWISIQVPELSIKRGEGSLCQPTRRGAGRIK